MCKSEQESEKNVQEFSQKIEEMKRSHDLEVESLEHESQLKKDNEEVRCSMCEYSIEFLYMHSLIKKTSRSIW